MVRIRLLAAPLLVGAYFAARGAMAQSADSDDDTISKALGRNNRIFDAPPEPGPPVQTKTRWYGAPILGIDAVGIVGIIGGMRTSDNEWRAAIVGGATLYALGGPTVHSLEGRLDKVGASLALRVAPPLLIMAPLGFQTLGCTGTASSTCGAKTEMLAHVFTVLLPIASLIDSVFLAREQVPVLGNSSVHMHVEPWLNPSTKQFGATFAGTF